MEKSVRTVMMRPVERSMCCNTLHIGMAVISNAFVIFVTPTKHWARFKYLAIDHISKYMVAI